MSRTFAYCRISTADRTAENQAHQIAAAGFNVEARRTVSETVSGSVPAMQRPGFAKLMDRLERGDVVIVTKLDRLGRDTIDVVSTVDRLATLGVRVHCLALGGVDLTSAAGRMVMTTLMAVAQFERDLIIERTQAGLARVRAEGRKLGRPEALDASQRDAVRAALASGESVSALSRQYGVGRATINRAAA